MFLNKLQKAINEVDVFKTPWQLYFITNTVQVCFLREVDLKVLHRFLRKNVESQFFYKDKQA